MPSTEPNDRFVSPTDPMPCHYMFVSDPDQAEACRELAYGQNHMVQTVRNAQGVVIGVRVPISVYQSNLSRMARR